MKQQSIPTKDVYSTSETFTGKYWIDGKPIYRRVIETTISSNTSYKNINNIGISSTLDQIIELRAITESGASEYAYRPIPFAYDQSGWNAGITYVKSADLITIQFGSAFCSTYAGKKVYVIVEYTKV